MFFKENGYFHSAPFYKTWSNMSTVQVFQWFVSRPSPDIWGHDKHQDQGPHPEHRQKARSDHRRRLQHFCQNTRQGVFHTSQPWTFIFSFINLRTSATLVYKNRVCDRISFRSSVWTRQTTSLTVWDKSLTGPRKPIGSKTVKKRKKHYLIKMEVGHLMFFCTNPHKPLWCVCVLQVAQSTYPILCSSWGSCGSMWSLAETQRPILSSITLRCIWMVPLSHHHIFQAH